MEHLKTTIYFLTIFIGLFTASSASAAITIRPALNLGLVGYWSMDEGTGAIAGDFSGNRNDGSASGGPAWVDGKRGKALDFDGGNDKVIISHNANLGPTPDTNNWTVSAWVKTTDTSGSIVCKDNSATAGCDGDYYILEIVSGEAQFQFNAGDASSIATANGTTSVNDGAWHHITGVRSGIKTANIYVDGVWQASHTHVGSLTGINTTRNLSIGEEDGTNLLDAIIDEVRVYNRALSGEEATKLYETGLIKFRPASDNGLVGYWSLDEGMGTKAGDMSGMGHDGTASGSPAWVDGKRGKALSFNGTSDCFSVGTFNFGNVSTISAWVNIDTGESSIQTIMANSVTGAAADGFRLFVNTYGTSDQKLFIETGNGSAGDGAISAAGAVPYPGWHHIVAVLDRTNGLANAYVDGVQVITNDSIQTDFGNNQWTRIGRMSNSSYYFGGIMDEVRVYNRALSATEIANLYTSSNRYLRVNAPQNNKVTNGLVGFWSFNGQDVSGATAYDRSGSGNNGTITGATLDSGKVGQALRFNGASNYLDTNHDYSWSNAQPFSMSVWFNTNNPFTNQVILSKDTTSNWEYTLRLNANGSLSFHYWNTGGNDEIVVGTDASEIATSTWYHAAVTYDGVSNAYLYLNSIEKASDATIVDTFQNRADTTRIGYGYYNSGTAYYFNGLLDEVRIYNRALSAAEVKRLYNMGK